MADRYWRGGTGTWSSTNTANWSTSSGGAGGASVPTAADNVFFDANSNVGTGAFTVTMANSPRVCNDITISGLDGTMTLAGLGIGLTVSGSLSFPATNFTITYTNTTTFNATTTGKTITTNGVAFGGDVTLDGVGGAWTLGSAFSCGSNSLTLTNGTFDTSVSNYAVTAGIFFSSNSNVRTINLNASTLSLSDFLATNANATLNAGTSTINLSKSNATFAGGTLTYYNVSFTSTAALVLTKSITGANTFNNLTFSTIGAVGLNNITINANQTINGTLTINGANGNQRQFIRSDQTGVARTLTCAAIASTTDVDFRDITIAGAHGTLSGTRLGDCGGNSNITFVAGTSKYWNLAAGGNWNANGWATSSGGGVATTNYPLPQDTAIIENTGLNTSATITINGAWNIGTLDTSTRTNAMTLASSTFSPTFYGNFTYGSGVTPTGTGTYTFSNRTTKTLNSGGKTFTQAVLIDAPGGVVQLVTNNLTLGVTLTTTLLRGAIDLNNLTLSTGLFSSSNSNTRTIAFGTTGSIVTTTTTAGSTVLSMATATNFTFTGTSNISAAMSTTRTFRFGDTAGAIASNRLNINLTSGSSFPTFQTGSTFRQINFTGSTCTPSLASCHGFTLASGGNYIAANFTMVGTGTLTYTGKAINSLNINTAGITTTLADAGQNATTTLTNGTLDLAGFTLTNTTSAATATGTKNLTFNGGTLVCSAASATAWNNAAPTGFTTTAGTGTGTISMTAATAKTFVGGGSTYNCTLNQGGAGTLTITGANTFNDITNTNATASQITFPASTTNTFNNFTLSGSSGNLVSIRSSTPATQFTLSKASGTVNASFLDIQDSNATGGATWNAPTSNGNVDSGNNTGWVFAAIVIYDVSILESITASDSILLSLTRLGAVLESATVSDAAASQLTANGAILESAAVSDSAASQLTANGAILESATVSDSAASQLTAVGLVSEQATISDTPENILIRFGDVSEQAVQSDNAASQLTAVASVSEQAAQSDSAASQLTAVAAISEQATQSDSAVSQLTAVGLVSESAALSDSTNSQITFLTNIIEQIALSDAASTILIRFGNIAEQSTLSDSAASQITATALISETAVLSDAVQALMVFFCTIREGNGPVSENTFAFPLGTSFTGSLYFDNTSAGGGLAVVANGTGTGSTGGFNAGGNYVLFSGVNTRSIRTKSLNLTQCDTFNFSIIRGTSSNGGEQPDSSENIIVEYSINGGTNYTTIATILNTAAITTFTTLSYSMPVAAKTSATIIRWRQATASLGAFDQYGIRAFTFDGQDRIFVSDSPAARLVRQGLITEQSALTDTPAARLIRQGLITELSRASQTSAARLVRQGLLFEQSFPVDATAASLIRRGIIAEQAAGNEAAAVQLVRQGQINEQSSLSDTLSSLVSYLVQINEQGAATVSLTTQMTLVASVIEQAASADQAVGNFITSVFVTESITVADEALIRFLWELIQDNQVPNWQNASNTQSPTWSAISTSTTTNWQNVATSQSSGWGVINTDSDGNWININTQPE